MRTRVSFAVLAISEDLHQEPDGKLRLVPEAGAPSPGSSTDMWVQARDKQFSLFASLVGVMDSYTLNVTSALMPIASRISCSRDIATV
jgi:hypothetical protein